MAEGGFGDHVRRWEKTGALRGELGALLATTRSRVLLALTAGLVVVNAAGTTRFSRISGAALSQPLDERRLAFIMGSALAAGTIGALVLGALAVPRARLWPSAAGRLLAFGAKTAANALVALVYGAVSVGLAFAALVAVSTSEGAEVPGLFDRAVVNSAVAGLAAYPLWAVIGIGVGAIAGGDIAAVGAALLWPQVERSVTLVLDVYAPALSPGYLPLSATTVMFSAPAGPGISVVGVTTRSGAAMVLAVYALAFFGLGVLVVSRRHRAEPGAVEEPGAIEEIGVVAETGPRPRARPPGRWYRRAHPVVRVRSRERGARWPRVRSTRFPGGRRARPCGPS